MRTFNFVGRMPVLLFAAGVLVTAGCERTKSSTPLSPSIAGPIAGVTITPPTPMQPAAGLKIKDTEQPITLEFGNADSNSPRPYTLSLQVAADTGFGSPVYAQVGIPPAESGVSRLLLPAKLQAGRTYYWRIKAEDGANESEWTEPIAFEVLQPIVIGIPNPVAPVGNVRVTTQTPELRVRNAVSSGPHLPLEYNFQVSTTPSFNSIMTNDWVPEGGAETAFTVPYSPAGDVALYWRVRAADDEGNAGGWSRTESYRTQVIASGGGGGGGGGVPGTPGNCASNNGPTIVKCIESKYPSYLAAGVSSHQREANMAFLRDRIIEAGICGGLELGWNRKRGNGPHSIDALAWRTGHGDEVVDVGSAYDDTGRTLGLQWGIVAGPPGFDGYSPRPNCQ